MRPLYFGLGWGFLALAGIGVIVPGMPTTVFCILALWAFKKSSPKMEAWLLAHPLVGPTLRDWEADKSIKLRTKIVAISVMWLVMAVSIWLIASKPAAPGSVSQLVGELGIACVGVLVSAYIWTRKTKITPTLSHEPA